MDKLLKLKEEFNSLRQDYMQIGQKSLSLQWNQGRVLTELKKEVGHKNWLPLLKELEVKDRTARLYLRLFRAYPKSAMIADFDSMAEALRVYGKKKKLNEKPTTKPKPRSTKPTTTTPSKPKEDKTDWKQVAKEKQVALSHKDGELRDKDGELRDKDEKIEKLQEQLKAARADKQPVDVEVKRALAKADDFESRWGEVTDELKKWKKKYEELQKTSEDAVKLQEDLERTKSDLEKVSDGYGKLQDENQRLHDILQENGISAE